MANILIKRANILNPDTAESLHGDIFISDGKVEKIGEDLFEYMNQADEIIDANGLTAAPGLVDMHVHLRDPGFQEKEDIFSAARAAAAGGVTSLLAMPNTNPVVDSAEVVEYILERAKNADVHIYTAASVTKGLKGDELTDIDSLKKAGAIVLSDDGRPVINTQCLVDGLIKAKELGMTFASHCEDLYLSKDGLLNDGTVAKVLGIKGIPNSAEDCATAREIAAAAAVDAPIHICHVSTAGSVELIRDAKRRGVKVTAETAPHYLLLTDIELYKKDADYRMSPPLRTEKDRLALIEGLKDGTIDVIATDHAPHTVAEKSDFFNAPNGAIGMETLLAASITALVKTGEMTLSELLVKMSSAPAKLLSISAGEIGVGKAADIMLFDENERWVVDSNALHGKSKNTPFKGMELTGRVKYTITGGRKVYDCKYN